jgi:transcriptional regulator GlxA family with amidase domain
MQSDLPIVDLALACGFVSASHFSKCYRQLFSRSPREERATAVQGGVRTDMLRATAREGSRV